LLLDVLVEQAVNRDAAGVQNAGLVRIYRRQAAGWVLEQTVASSAPAVHQHFGAAVALDGDTLVVGAPYGFMGFLAPSGLAQAGFVEVFKRQAGVWVRQQRLVGSNSRERDGFGTSCALQSDQLLVGVLVETPSLYHFRDVAGSWQEVSAFGSTIVFQVGLNDGLATASHSSGLTIWSLGIANASNYCSATPNSTGLAGTLSATGCDSLSGNDFTLEASSLPVGEPGLFLFGSTQAQTPLGQGTLCVGAPFYRLPLGIVQPDGTLRAQVDFGSAPGTNVMAGVRWYFQAYYRDRAAAPGAINLTDGYAVELIP